MTTERTPEIRIGLSEPAHVTTKVNGTPVPNRHYFQTLNTRATAAERMGFTAYEAMPTPSTAVSTLFLDQGGIARVQSMVVNIHSPWTDDRWVHPESAETDTWLEGTLRHASSEVMSASDWTLQTMARLARETDASITTHWPHYETKPVPILTQRQNIPREMIQERLNAMNAVVIAENHVLIGMTDSEMDEWLRYSGKSKPRGLAFVSGRDVRDEEYAGKPSVDPMNHLPFVRGLYIKDGWSPDVLTRDLRSIRESGNTHDLWVMVNTSSGANEKTAHQLMEIAEQVTKG